MFDYLSNQQHLVDIFLFFQILFLAKQPSKLGRILQSNISEKFDFQYMIQDRRHDFWSKGANF